MREKYIWRLIVADNLHFILWLVFFVLLGCVIILGPSTVSVDNSVKRPVLTEPDTADDIDWIEWE